MFGLFNRKKGKPGLVGLSLILDSVMLLLMLVPFLLVIRHGVMPRTLHAEEPSPHVDWSAGAVELLTEARSWETGGRPRRAGGGGGG